jgi:sulfite exporter TauE/SafE
LYGVGKTLSYLTIGAAFGAVGSLLTITPFMKGAMAIAAGMFLVLYGLRMLNLFSGPSWLNWVFPKFLMRGVQSGIRRQPKPLVIGLLSGFLLGCGPLQAMYIMAAGTGSPLEGASLLLFFGLGTLGPLLGFGFFANLLSQRMMNELLRVSGVLVLLMGLMMTDRGLRLTESGIDFDALRERWQMFMRDAGPHTTGHGEHC